MARKGLNELDDLGATPADADYLPIVDASDTSEHADGTAKRVTFADLVAASNVGTSGTPVATDYARFTDADTIEGRSPAEVRSDLNVEDGADVTDATNVDAAGATMNTDTDVSATGWVLDEDDFASDSATKVPTQQSVKAWASGTFRADDAPIRVAGRSLETISAGTTRIGSFFGMALDGASTEAFGCNFLPPASWSTFDVVLEFAALTADTDDVRLQVRTYDVGSGDTINTAGPIQDTATATLQGQHIHTEATVASGVARVAGEVVGVRVERLGGDAADTSTGDVLVYGVRFVKAS